MNNPIRDTLFSSRTPGYSGNSEKLGNKARTPEVMCVKPEAFLGLYSFSCQVVMAKLYSRAIRAVCSNDIAMCAYQYIDRRKFKNTMLHECIGTVALTFLALYCFNPYSSIWLKQSACYAAMALGSVLAALMSVTFRNQYRVMKTDAILLNKLNGELSKDAIKELHDLSFDDSPDPLELRRILKKNKVNVRTLDEKILKWLK